MAKTFSTKEACELLCLTEKQIRKLDLEGFVTPVRVPRRGGGLRRAYSDQQMAELAMVAALKRKGFSLQMIRELIVAVRLSLLERPPYIFISSDFVIPCKTEREIVRLLCKARRGSFLLEPEYFV